jgi:hypothetical protein
LVSVEGTSLNSPSTPNLPQSHKLEIDTGKWLLSKLCYRHRVDLRQQISGPDSGPVQIDQAVLLIPRILSASTRPRCSTVLQRSFVLRLRRPVQMPLRFERIEANLSAIYNLDERHAGIQRGDGRPSAPRLSYKDAGISAAPSIGDRARDVTVSKARSFKSTMVIR